MNQNLYIRIMPAVNSTMLEIGTKAPEFSLTDVKSGKKVSLDDYRNKNGLLVAFICNHCPYVKHLKSVFVEFAIDVMSKGVGVVAISSNDADKYPDDSPEKMKEDAEEFSYPFPYLYDESQEVAKAYRAACTPDFFLFDSDLELAYRGQFDGSRPGNDQPVNGEDIKQAVDSLLAGESVTEQQIPSIGCSIKWKKGNEPDYFG